MNETNASVSGVFFRAVMEQMSFPMIPGPPKREIFVWTGFNELCFRTNVEQTCLLSRSHRDKPDGQLKRKMEGPAGLAVKPLDLHLVHVGSIPTGPTHSEGRLQPHPGDVLKSTPNVRKGPRSGLNLEGSLSDPQFTSGHKAK